MFSPDRYAWRTVLGIVLTTAIVAGCANSGMAPAKVPASVTDAGEFGENIYDAAKGGDWTTATQKLESLKKAADQLAAEIPSMNAEQQANRSHLAADIAALQKAISAKDKQVSIEKANDVTLIADQFAASFGPKMPIEVAHLDYLGRELEVWAGANDLRKLQQVAVEIQATWSKVRPTIEAKGAADVAKKFTTLVAHVTAAKTSNDFAAAAKPLLDEVDNLEKVFSP
jgi:hypothetical protein